VFQHVSDHRGSIISICLHIQWTTHTVTICCHNTDLVHVNGNDRIILVIFSQALHKAPWWWILCDPKHVGALLNTGLFKMILGVLRACRTQHTSDSSICVFLFNRTTLQVSVTYLTGALYVHPLWFYKHQHDNPVRSKLFVAWQRWWFQWRFWFVPSVPGYLREEEEHKPDPWHNPIERNHMGLHLENAVASW